VGAACCWAGPYDPQPGLCTSLYVHRSMALCPSTRPHPPCIARGSDLSREVSGEGWSYAPQGGGGLDVRSWLCVAPVRHYGHYEQHRADRPPHPRVVLVQH